MKIAPLLLLNYHRYTKRKVCIVTHLSLNQLSQTSDGRSDGGSSSSRDGVRTTGDGLVASLAFPDTSSLSLNGLLSAERTVVSRVLLNLKLLTLSSQRRTVSDTVFTGDSNLFSSFRPKTK